MGKRKSFSKPKAVPTLVDDILSWHYNKDGLEVCREIIEKGLLDSVAECIYMKELDEKAAPFSISLGLQICLTNVLITYANHDMKRDDHVIEEEEDFEPVCPEPDSYLQSQAVSKYTVVP